ncbi:hypothetical protein LZ30DRAFT_171703 [Colletotrichum cereale]|nr:hypothetical protein LZ30DRAFT_171703 [Colletotrichum cereale]
MLSFSTLTLTLSSWRIWLKNSMASSADFLCLLPRVPSALGPASTSRSGLTLKHVFPALDGKNRWHDTPVRHGSSRTVLAFLLMLPPLFQSFTHNAHRGNASGLPVFVNKRISTLCTVTRRSEVGRDGRLAGLLGLGGVVLPSRTGYG